MKLFIWEDNEDFEDHMTPSYSPDAFIVVCADSALAPFCSGVIGANAAPTSRKVVGCSPFSLIIFNAA